MNMVARTAGPWSGYFGLDFFGPVREPDISVRILIHEWINDLNFKFWNRRKYRDPMIESNDWV